MSAVVPALVATILLGRKGAVSRAQVGVNSWRVLVVVAHLSPPTRVPVPSSRRDGGRSVEAAPVELPYPEAGARVVRTRRLSIPAKFNIANFG